MEDDILQSGCVSVVGDKIGAVSAATLNEEGVDLQGLYLAPGFVDIHCHGSGEYWFFDHPAEAAEWHLKEGTTSLLCSMWRNAGNYSFEQAIKNVKAAMGPDRNIRGIHMEGPYLDPDYGSEGGKAWPVDPAEYNRLIEVAKGCIRTWCFDPLQPGARDFAAAAQRAGIVLSVCYSKATPELLLEYADYGLRIGNHILCGSGSPKPKFGGTKEPGSDQFFLCDDRMTCEVIADSVGGHVRPYYLKFIYKCKGADRIALVSDCCADGETNGSDVNIIDGELYGSRLTLSVAVRNMRRYTEASLVELIRMVSATPAKAVGLYAERGSIAAGKAADFALLDDELNVRGVILGGKFIRKDF